MPKQAKFVLILFCITLIIWALNRPYVQIGLASRYSNFFKGRKTASGERYDPAKLTAAHRNLPFGSVVKVTNLENNKKVIVRINDRGPYKTGRIIDLSRAAARKLEMLEKGVVKVKIERVK